MKKYIFKYLFSAQFILLLLFCVNGCSDNSIGKDKDNMNILQFFVMNSQEVSKIYPNGYDTNVAKEKGLISNGPGEEKYQRMQAAYLAVFNRYLEDTIDLSKYEAELQNSGYNFYPIKDNLYYSYRSYGRNNIYLRNTAYIEHLDSDQLALLERSISGNEVLLTPELTEMVADTWKDIFVAYLDPDNKSIYKINYEMESVNGFSSYNNSLTFELGYCKEYDAKGNLIDSNVEKEKITLAYSVIEQIEEEISKELDCPVKVFLLVGVYCG